jgi:hypothetical protein
LTNQKENLGGYILNHSQSVVQSSFSQDSFMPAVKEPPKTKRDKGLKYFKKVGYTKDRMKAIPRWCTNM